MLKLSTLVAILLILVGVVVLAYQGITYTTREKVIDLGSVEATVKKTKTIPLPPVFGGVVLAGGIVLLAMSSRRP